MRFWAKMLLGRQLCLNYKKNISVIYQKNIIDYRRINFLRDEKLFGV